MQFKIIKDGNFQNVCERIEVRSYSIPHIIGERFRMINNIKESTGANIVLQGNSVIIQGKRESVFFALKEIEKIVAWSQDQNEDVFTGTVNVSKDKRWYIYGKKAGTLRDLERETNTKIDGNKGRFTVTGNQSNVERAIEIIKLKTVGIQEGKEYRVNISPKLNGVLILNVTFPDGQCYQVHEREVQPNGAAGWIETQQDATIKILRKRGDSLLIDIIDLERFQPTE